MKKTKKDEDTTSVCVTGIERKAHAAVKSAATTRGTSQNNIYLKAIKAGLPRLKIVIPKDEK